MQAAAIPPAKKHAPMTYANTGLWLAATRYATRAPTKVPTACARKGKTKCFGSNRCIDSLRLWGSDTSTPAGGGITRGLAMPSPMLTPPPTIRPTTTARMFRSTFIRVIPPCDDAKLHAAAHVGVERQVDRAQEHLVGPGPGHLGLQQPEVLRGRLALRARGEEDLTVLNRHVFLLLGVKGKHRPLFSRPPTRIKVGRPGAKAASRAPGL